MREGCSEGGKGPLVSKDKSLTLATGNDQVVFQPITHREVSGTLRANAGAPKHEADWEQLVCQPIPINDKATRHMGGGSTRNHDGSGNGLGVGKPGDPCPTLTAGDRHAVAHFTPSSFGQYAEGVGTLRAEGGDLGGGSETLVVKYRVRRLTPVECLRLQGFPDTWLDLPGASDSAKYKAVGNSIAVPCPDFIFRRMMEVLEK